MVSRYLLSLALVCQFFANQAKTRFVFMIHHDSPVLLWNCEPCVLMFSSNAVRPCQAMSGHVCVQLVLQTLDPFLLCLAAFEKGFKKRIPMGSDPSDAMKTSTKHEENINKFLPEAGLPRPCSHPPSWAPGHQICSVVTAHHRSFNKKWYEILKIYRLRSEKCHPRTMNGI